MVADVELSMKGKSSDELKEMLEKTSIEEVAEPEEETAEAVETEGEEAEASTEEETPPKKEETKEEKPKTETEKKLYKIKVEGKEEELDEEKLKEYAQKGRYLEKERAKDREERKRFEEERAKAGQPVDWAKLNEQFVEMLQKDPLGALTTLYEAKKQDEVRMQREERRADRLFETEKKEEVPHWESIKPLYQEFRDLGNSREEAFLKAENEFLKNLTVTLREKGFEEGKQKTILKQKAEMPLKEKKTKGGVGMPTPEELSKMTSAQIAKHLKFVKNTGY